MSNVSHVMSYSQYSHIKMVRFQPTNSPPAGPAGTKNDALLTADCCLQTALAARKASDVKGHCRWRRLTTPPPPGGGHAW